MEPTTVVGQRDDLFINTHDGVTFVYTDDTGAGSPGWIRAGGSASLSIALKGSVANAAALPNGAAAGDVYITLDDDQGNVSDGQGNWAKVGPIRGPRGDQGLTGPPGRTVLTDRTARGSAGRAGPRGP